MEQKVKIIVDSTAYLTRAFVEEHDIQVVPLSYEFEGKRVEEGLPGSFDEFFTRLEKGKDFPKTSQPSVSTFADLFSKAVHAGEQVIAIVISSGVSGTYQAAKLASKDFDKDCVTVLDSKSGAVGVYFLVRKALAYARENLPYAQIVERLQKDIEKLRFVIAVPNLEYLARGGRLSTAAKLLGNVLNICPIIALTDGSMGVIERARGFERALRKLASHMPQEVEWIGICHAKATATAARVREMLQPLYPGKEIELREVGPVMGAHFGPGAIGICCLGK